MKHVLILTSLLALVSYADQGRELAHIQLHEWGVLTLGEGGSVLSSLPGSVPPEPTNLLPYLPSGDPNGPLLRAPVLYFHGPAFTGTVSVKTANGTIFDVYPMLSDTQLNDNYLTWSVRLSRDAVDVYPEFNPGASGNWNINRWRSVDALTVRGSDGWADRFLYYETAPVSTDFLPYTAGTDSLCDEYANTDALLIKRINGSVFYLTCTLRDIVTGNLPKYSDADPDGILSVLYGWSVNVIEIDEVDALWSTWGHWILNEAFSEPDYSDGLVIYLLPENLADNLSSIDVHPEEARFPVDISRYLLVAVPL